MASSVALSEHQSRTKLWELPEFGDSPVSSPPRTPPPEPAMPSTPSLVRLLCEDREIFACRVRHVLIIEDGSICK